MGRAQVWSGCYSCCRSNTEKLLLLHVMQHLGFLPCGACKGRGFPFDFLILYPVCLLLGERARLVDSVLLNIFSRDAVLGNP